MVKIKQKMKKELIQLTLTHFSVDSRHFVHKLLLLIHSKYLAFFKTVYSKSTWYIQHNFNIKELLQLWIAEENKAFINPTRKWIGVYPPLR